MKWSRRLKFILQAARKRKCKLYEGDDISRGVLKSL
jgi:hypothetical protein